MATGYWNDLGLFESKNRSSVDALAEREMLAKTAKEERFAKERAFKPKLDIELDKIIKRKFRNIETAMSKDARIGMLFRRAKSIVEEVAAKELSVNGRKVSAVLRVGDLTEREKIILMELIKR